MSPRSDPPVIAIDGPSASGKGTVAVEVAKALGFHYLDSGALYRLVTLAALAVWAIASIRSEAALNTPSPMAIAVQSDPIDLMMKTAGNLPSEQFDPF